MDCFPVQAGPSYEERVRHVNGCSDARVITSEKYAFSNRDERLREIPFLESLGHLKQLRPNRPSMLETEPDSLGQLTAKPEETPKAARDISIRK